MATYEIEWNVTAEHAETIDTEANSRFWGDLIERAGLDPDDPDAVYRFFESEDGKGWLADLGSGTWVQDTDVEITDVQPESDDCEDPS